MSASSPSRSPSSHSQAHRVAILLYRSLERALREQFDRRYKAEVGLRPLGELASVTLGEAASSGVASDGDRSDDAAVMRFRVDCRGLTQMPVRFVVTPVRQRTYDVFCGVENGATHRFSFCLPGEGRADLSDVPCLGRDVATFLRGELERRLGQLLLRSPARPPTQKDSALF